MPANESLGEQFDGEILHRGLNVRLPKEHIEQIKNLSNPAMHPDEFNQHLKIGPMLLEHLESFNNPNYSSGLGRHWTSSEMMAETAAIQGNVGGMPIIVSARTRKQDIETDPRRLIGNQFHGEDETTFKPGSEFDVTDLRISAFGGGRFESVWDTKGEGTGREAWERKYGEKYKPEEWED